MSSSASQTASGYACARRGIGTDRQNAHIEHTIHSLKQLHDAAHNTTERRRGGGIDNHIARIPYYTTQVMSISAAQRGRQGEQRGTAHKKPLSQNFIIRLSGVLPQPNYINPTIRSCATCHYTLLPQQTNTSHDISSTQPRTEGVKTSHSPGPKETLPQRQWAKHKRPKRDPHLVQQVRKTRKSNHTSQQHK